jgi:hypothetical protein
MIKRILILLLLLMITGYLIVAVTILNAKPANQRCNGMEVFIADSTDYGLITKKLVSNFLETRKAFPVGKMMDDINTKEMEKLLKKIPLIDNVECYKTSDQKIGIEINQRIPIIRIMSNNGENYYVDSKGKVMPIVNNPIYVPIVTGFIDRNMATNQIYKLGEFLNNKPFWKAQIEQINITPTKEVEIVPMVGDHIIFLGKAENYDDKFSRLKIFYERALNVVGWNKYDRISLEFSNQIICTKKE